MSEEFELKKLSVKYPPMVATSKCGNICWYYANGCFHIIDENGDYEVQRAFTDKILRGIDPEKLVSFLAKGNYLLIDKLGDDEFTVSARVRGLGGGFLGATAGAYLGAGLVNVASYSLLFGVSFVAGPLQPAVFTGLCATFSGTIQAAAVTTAMATGITGAVLTGPV